RHISMISAVVATHPPTLGRVLRTGTQGPRAPDKKEETTFVGNVRKPPAPDCYPPRTTSIECAFALPATAPRASCETDLNCPMMWRLTRNNIPRLPAQNELPRSLVAPGKNPPHHHLRSNAYPKAPPLPSTLD